MEQQLFVHANCPPRQSGQTFIENDAPLRMATDSIVTGQQICSSVGEFCHTSMSTFDLPTQDSGMLHETVYVLPIRTVTRFVSPARAIKLGSGNAQGIEN